MQQAHNKRMAGPALGRSAARALRRFLVVAVLGAVVVLTAMGGGADARPSYYSACTAMTTGFEGHGAPTTDSCALPPSPVVQAWPQLAAPRDFTLFFFVGLQIAQRRFSLAVGSPSR